MKIVQLAFSNLWHRRMSGLLSLILVIFGVVILVSLIRVNDFLEQQFYASKDNIDVVVGAKGSPLQLVLANVYHVDNPTGNIPLQAASKLAANPLIKEHTFIAYGDYYDGVRILGGSPSIYTFFNLQCSSGTLPAKANEVIISESLAKNKAWAVGRTFKSSHGQDGGDEHEDEFTVVGIFANTGTAMDRVLVTNLASIWGVHHLEASQPKEITAVLVRFKTAMAKLTFPAFINKQTAFMAALPAIEMNRLLTLIGGFFRLVYILAIGVVVLSGVSLFLNLMTSMKERKPELAVLRLQGASRFFVFRLVILEAILIAAAGTLIGWLIAELSIPVVISDLTHVYTSFDALNALQALAAVFGGMMGLAILAAVVPALNAYRLSITDLLKEQ